MTAIEYAICRYAARHMTPRQLTEARVLAGKAEAGDEAARKALDDMAYKVIRDGQRRNGRNPRR